MVGCRVSAHNWYWEKSSECSSENFILKMILAMGRREETDIRLAVQS